MRPLNTSLLLQLVTPPTIGKRSIVMSVSVCVRVCVFVCPQSYLRNYMSDLYQFLCMLPWLVLLWRRVDALCTSGNKSRLLDVAAQLKRSAHAALGLAINYAQ